jgi:hypothetical protein
MGDSFNSLYDLRTGYPDQRAFTCTTESSRFDTRVIDGVHRCKQILSGLPGDIPANRLPIPNDRLHESLPSVVRRPTARKMLVDGATPDEFAYQLHLPMPTSKRYQALNESAGPQTCVRSFASF